MVPYPEWYNSCCFRWVNTPNPHDEGLGLLQPNHASKLLPVLVWSLAGLIIVLAVVFAVTAATLPGCSGCHNQPKFVQQTATGPHATIPCSRCHVQNGPANRTVFAYHLIFGMALRVSPLNSGPVASVPNETCLSCHSDVMSGITKSKGLNIQHAQCSKGRLCTDCHSNTAHGTATTWVRTATMNDCLDCHDTARVRSDCNMCHTAKTAEERLRTGEWVVTHGPGWRKTHGMGTLKSCAACHPDNFCVKCHEIQLPHDTDFVRSHPVDALSHRKACEVCHKQTFCDDCHGLQMPHPPSFTPQHSKIVHARGKQTCLKCHIEDDCTNCHVKHVHPGGAITPPNSGVQ